MSGKMIINEESRWAMKECLENIQNGNYAKRFIDEGANGYPEMDAARTANAAHPIEQGGAELCKMMPWIEANKIIDKSKNSKRVAVVNPGPAF